MHKYHVFYHGVCIGEIEASQISKKVSTFIIWYAVGYETDLEAFRSIAKLALVSDWEFVGQLGHELRRCPYVLSEWHNRLEPLCLRTGEHVHLLDQLVCRMSLQV